MDSPSPSSQKSPAKKTNGRIHVPPAPPDLSSERTNSPEEGAPKSGKSKLPWIIAGVLGALTFVAIVLLVIVAAGAFFFFSLRAPSTTNDFVASPATAESDYLAWRSALDRLGQPALAGSASTLPAPAGQAPGFWDKIWTLPPGDAVSSALARRLPPGMTVESLTPVAFVKQPDGVQATYRLRLRSSGTLVAVATTPLVPRAGASPTLRKWTPWLIASPDLPAGLRYAAETARPVVQAGQVVETDWTVRRATRSEGKWRVTEADPLVYQRQPAFEKRLLSTPGARPFLLRAESEITSAQAQEAQAIQQAEATLADIQSRVTAYRAEALSNLPSGGTDTGGRGGSGTPTKTGVGALSGAAVGGGIGALAGDGEGAAIGAGAGALLGGIIGYNVGRGDEKRAASRQNSARQQAINSANSRTRTYEAQLYSEAEASLKAQAEAHNARLAGNY